MLDPNQVIEAFKTHSLLPTATPTSVSPIPTVIPNRPHVELVHNAGKTTLWVGFVAMLFFTVVLAFLAWRAPVQKRLFEILGTFITAISAIAYYVQATGAGSTLVHYVIKESHKHVPDTYEDIFRQVFWAHAVDSVLTFPVVLLLLSFLAGISGANILVILFANVFLGLSVLSASFGTANDSKWGYFVFALLSLLVIAYILIVPGRRAVQAKGDTASGKLYGSISAYTVIVWALYLVVWAVTEGTRKFSVDVEVIAYFVLDALSKPVFALWLIFAHKNKPSIDGFWSHGLVTEGAVRLDDDEV